MSLAQEVSENSLDDISAVAIASTCVSDIVALVRQPYYLSIAILQPSITWYYWGVSHVYGCEKYTNLVRGYIALFIIGSTNLLSKLLT